MSHGILRTEILPRLQRVKPEGDKYRASCPVPNHGKGRGDRIPSFTIEPGTRWAVVFTCHAGCDQDAIKNALISLGVNWDLVTGPPRERPDADQWMPCGWDADTRRHDWAHRKVAEYLYHHEDGSLAFAVARCALKGNGCQGFRQWRPDPAKRTGKTWSRRLPDGTKVGDGLPYRLPQIIAAVRAEQNIWICEGEADVNRLVELGHAATCNAEGAGKWTDVHAAWLAGANVVIVADLDRPGWVHAQNVANSLLDLAQSIEVVCAADGKDARDHLDAGRSVGAFVTVATPLEPRIDLPTLAVAA